MRGHKRKFKQFIAYLCKNYLNQNCRLPHSLWNYHASLSESDYCLTTNALENLNGKLKAKVGQGFLSRNKGYKKSKNSITNILLNTQQKLPETECPKSSKFILIGKVN